MLKIENVSPTVSFWCEFEMITTEMNILITDFRSSFHVLSAFKESLCF